MPGIKLKAKLFKIDSWTVLVLPKSASAKLPSRGQVMVEGTVNGAPFQAPLEPDGRGSHWLKVDKSLLEATGAHINDPAPLDIKASPKWPEPKVPADIKKGLLSDKQAHSAWTDITPAARWDWIRWIKATSQGDTRKRRIANACDMLKQGKRRPCCFNRSICTEPAVSKNGVLLAPASPKE